jgi:hypothetical protein
MVQQRPHRLVRAEPVDPAEQDHMIPGFDILQHPAREGRARALQQRHVVRAWPPYGFREAIDAALREATAHMLLSL